MPNVPSPPSFPGTASMSALRAWYAGVGSREAVERYCPQALEGEQSARGMTGRIRRQLVAFALSRHRDDLAQPFQCAAGERTRHRKAATRALHILPTLAVPQPWVSDPIGAWLPSRVVPVLHQHGIRTLADLTVRIPRRQRWWRTIPGLGMRSARHIEAFFAAHPALTERARALIVVATPEPVVPWESIRLPHEVDGSRGAFRAPKPMCVLEADNDYQAISAWLERHEAAETQRAYRREAERLLLWAIVEHGKALSSLTSEDATAYRAFLRRPAPRVRWIAPARPRSSSEWRPFTGTLSPDSIAYALSVLSAMFRWLIEQRYVLANPFAGLRVRGAQRNGELDISRAFTASEWELIRTIADGLEWSHGWAVPAAQRMRFLLDFGYATGLRAGELVSVTLGGIVTGAHGERWLHLTGKGAKAGKVVLPPLARFALDQYLMQRGLPVSPARWSPDMPLLGHLDESGGITTPRLREVLRRFFRTAADAIQADHPALADKLQRATPHWLRHTHATLALANGATLTTVRDNLRHASITTTSIYLDDDEVQRTRQIERIFTRRPPV
ncbi:site-specific recombinase XerD [Paraburkholderia sp. BL6665CI2N2]|uniref:phage integrase family protein n=1 Tax=Paraburkholderia sp. BL6665CI2N2 TaxID=1938806 RepID=UPI001065B1DD|nr:phage integrase family protein [Paraburkholderia sp. BL6665CI2N2]TDY16747.1 site-specific recombinase XerD [Paraburkholderia sp. BL6665CI2N2]